MAPAAATNSGWRWYLPAQREGTRWAGQWLGLGCGNRVGSGCVFSENVAVLGWWYGAPAEAAE